MAKISPEAFAVLSRVKRYGFGTWQPGRFVISNARDTTFIRSHAAILTELIDAGYLAVDSFGAVSTGLAGEHELRGHVTPLAESRSTVAGRRFSVVTADWDTEAEAANVRQSILDGLAALAESNSEKFDTIFYAIVAGLENDSLSRLVQTATGRPRSEEGRRVGVRIYGGGFPD